MRWLPALVVSVLVAPGLASAASGPKWSPAQLSEFADVVVTGTVTEVSSGWDHQLNAIYTYVTLTVGDVLKGDLDAQRITIKQLGGVAGAYVLSVVDQPTFVAGEDVLLYLEVRPRDGTLYTSALWQGKWEIQRGVRGRQVAVRHAPSVHGAVQDRQSLRAARISADAAGRSHASDIRTERLAGDGATVPRTSAGFNLLGPFRYRHVPAVDIQAGGQPGLSGGGFSQVQSAMQRWNSVGSTFHFVPGSSNAPPRCSSELLDNGRVTITFMDPCGEMSNSGGTLALGGSYYMPGEGGTFNGQAFDRAIEGFVINNDSPIALNFLTNPGCFEDVQAHELGHVLGLNHSSDPTALMFATIDDQSCVNGARGLQSDDVQGVLFIYGTTTFATTPPAAAPTEVRVAVQTTELRVTWTDPSRSTSAPATSYQVDFRSGHTDHGPLVASLHQTGLSVDVSVPPDVIGDFSVTVTGINAAGPGPASSRQDFTLGTTATCSSPPPAPTGLMGAVSNGFASAQWSAATGATRYLIQAGTSIGAADLVALTDLGPSTRAGASVPTGFRAWVRVFAANTCGVSAAADVFVQ